MKYKISLGILCGLLFLCIAGETGLCIGPADTLRNEIGEIIPIPPPGQAGVDYADLQFIALFKPGFLTLPIGLSEASLKQCTVEAGLDSLLTYHKVNYVKQVFTGSQLGDTIRVIGSDTCYVPDLSQIYLFSQKNGGVVLDAIEDLYSHDATLYAEPNYINIRANTEPNDTYWANQWNLKSIGNGIGCPTAWNSTTGESAIKIAIIDSGVDYDHEDLGGPGFPNLKVVGGYDYANNDNDPMDVYGYARGHGTPVAGLAGALSNNGEYIAGVAGGWDQGPYDVGAEIYALKIFRDNEIHADVVAAASAIWYGADPNHYGCQILNNSWGTENYSESIRFAMNFAYRVGASFTASKDNAGLADPWYPADNDASWVTCVGSYGQNGRYCIQGDNCELSSGYGLGIDLLAPGNEIYSIDNYGGMHLYFPGTSAACAQVSGSIALVRSMVPSLRNEDTEWILKYSADDGYDPSDDNVWTWHERYGHGDLRVSTAISRIYSPYQVSLYDFYEHTATGGYSVGNTGFYQMTFFGYPLSGNYNVKRYDVRVDVTYPEKFSGVPFVWGIGYGTTGWSAANPSYQQGWCRLAPGWQTQYGCQLQTYIYAVYNYLGQFMGWYPCEPHQVSLHYKIWGIKFLDTPRGPGGGKITGESVPREVSIKGNYPNPFNSSTLIDFGIPEESHLSIVIYDLLGRKVTTLLDKSVPAGYYSLNWDGKDINAMDVPSGIYFASLSSGGNVKTTKMTLLR